MRLRIGTAVILFCAAAVVAVTGGFRGFVGPVRISVQRPWPLATAGWLILMLGLRRHAEAQIAAAVAWIRRYATASALLLVGAILLSAVTFGAFVAAGADPYGYVSQALLWSHGNPLQFQSSLALEAPWPDAERSFCPPTYRPSSTSGLIAPGTWIGLPLQMAAAARLVGPRGVWAVVPISGALLVWLTYRFARRVCAAKEWAFVTTLLVAVSPVVLYQVVQPVSDVPSAVWWLASILTALEGSVSAALGSGVCAAIAILIRPNLVPLLVPLIAYLWCFRAKDGSIAIRLMAFLLGVTPGIALTIAANTIFYGSPAASGYGSVSDLVSWSNAPGNLKTYSVWMYQTHGAFPILALLLSVPVLVVHGGGDLRHRHVLTHSYLGVGFFATLFVCHAFVPQFDHWTYVRYLLPGIPVLMTVAVASTEAIVGSLSTLAQLAVLSYLGLVIPISYVNFARGGAAFKLRELFEDRSVEAARSIAAITPTNAIVISGLQSGSLRFYENRATVRYDRIPPDWSERSVAYFRSKGAVPYVALETTEAAGFRFPFTDSAARVLQSPSRVVDHLGLVRLYGPIQSGGR